MRILGIESSCDETACGVVENGTTVLSSVVASQVEVHRRFGGVVPEVASRQHLAVIDEVATKAVADAGLTFSDLDAIAVTQGPGLIGALLVGISYAKGLAGALGKPLIRVDHVHAHVHGALLDQNPPSYPNLSMVVSGGHTNLYRMADPLSFELLARSIDDACGECFDKVAKVLGMPYPGGPLIEQQASQSKGRVQLQMPRMVEEKSRLAFSYSGLKTHMINLLRKHGDDFVKEHLPEVCHAFQEEALGQLVRKIVIAVEKCPEAKALVIAGGVSANNRFKQMLEEKVQLPVLFPKRAYCSDNGAMIAGMAFHLFKKNSDPEHWSWHTDWDAYSRYKFA